ncbi:MAG: hypothetical protein ACKN9W_04415 [Methylococcus sp.]
MLSLIQNALGNPACFNTPLAEWRDWIVLSTINGLPVMGLNHMAWSPLPLLSQ